MKFSGLSDKLQKALTWHNFKQEKQIFFRYVY